MLGLYLAALVKAVSSVLVQEMPPTQQFVYYVSHILIGPEVQYSPIEKLTLALMKTVRKLRPYFQAHTIKVITDQPL